MGPDRLLIYIQRVFWRSPYIVGSVGVCTGVGTGVVGTTSGMFLGGVCVANCGVSRGVAPVCNPGVPPWITFGCFGDGVAVVEGIENLTL
jgi:hypothetical protein